MDHTIHDILERYRSLLKDIDTKCNEVSAQFPEIPCKKRCFDCCKQLFPLSFAETYCISEGFKTLDRKTRRLLQNNAEKINKKIMKANPSQFERRGVPKKEAFEIHSKFARFLHGLKMDCPALSVSANKGSCGVYAFRNHDCRTMGFSFDKSTNEIIGCYRFKTLGYLRPHLLDFYYRYSEKLALDKALLAEVANIKLTPNLLYYTTIATALLKDYAKTNWVKFFTARKVPEKAEGEKYWVVIDI